MISTANISCTKNAIKSEDASKISTLTGILTDFVPRCVSSLIIKYSFEDLDQRSLMKILDMKYLSNEARSVIREYTGVSWVAECITGYIPVSSFGEKNLGLNVNPSDRKALRYNITTHGCTYATFSELIIVRNDVYSNSLFLDYRSKHDIPSVFRDYKNIEISIPVAQFQDDSLCKIKGFCSCGCYHVL
jgi:hypothetical protein